MNENTSAQKEFIFIPDTCSCKHLCMYSFIHTIHPPTLFIQMCGTWSIEWFNKVPLVHLRHILYGLLMCKVIKWFHLRVFRFFNCRPTAQPFGDTSAEFRHITEWWVLLWNVFCVCFLISNAFIWFLHYESYTLIMMENTNKYRMGKIRRKQYPIQQC